MNMNASVKRGALHLLEQEVLAPQQGRCLTFPGVPGQQEGGREKGAVSLPLRRRREQGGRGEGPKGRGGWFLDE